jgi:hypothetical protein
MVCGQCPPYGSEGVNLVTSSNLTIDSSNLTIDSSNLTIDSSNLTIDSSNLTIDSSNLMIDSSNLTIDSSNQTIDHSSLRIDSANLKIDSCRKQLWLASIAHDLNRDIDRIIDAIFNRCTAFNSKIFVSIDNTLERFLFRLQIDG